MIRSTLLCVVLILGVSAPLAAPLKAQEAPAPRAVAGAPRTLAFGFLLDAGPPVTVRHVIRGSAVDRAGIQAGDVIVSVGGRPATVDAIREAARRATPGDTVRIRIRRVDREREVAVVPAAHPMPPAPPHAPRPTAREKRVVVIKPDSVRELVELHLDRARRALELRGDLDLKLDIDAELKRIPWDSLGEAIRLKIQELGPGLQALGRELGEIRIEGPEIEFSIEGAPVLRGTSITELDPELASYFPGAERGVLVLRVRPSSPAAEAGLRAGDVIVGIEGRPIASPSELRRALGREARALTVVRRGERITLALRS